MTYEMSVTRARAELADLVNRVAYSGEHVVLTRHGKPVAGLVSAEELEGLQARQHQESGIQLPAEPTSSRPMRIAAEHHSLPPAPRPGETSM